MVAMLQRASLVVALVILFSFLAGGCSEQASADARTMVFAASSLTASFEAVAAEFERAQPGSEIELHFAGSSQIVAQVKEGAPGDVFASADLANMQKLVDAGATASPPRVFARNRLAIVTGKGNPQNIRALADLARADLRVALCGPEVPAGKYAREALAKAAVTVPSVSDEPNVMALVGKVRLGEIDAGIVYVTDASDGDVVAVAIPEEHDVVAAYPIAVLAHGKGRARAEAFVAFVTSSAGQQILRRHGFLGP